MKGQTVKQHKVQHLIDQALEHQVTSGFTDDVYIKGRVCVSPAFTDKLIELILKQHYFIGEQWADGLIDHKHYAFVNRRVNDYFGLNDD